MVTSVRTLVGTLRSKDQIKGKQTPDHDIDRRRNRVPVTS